LEMKDRWRAPGMTAGAGAPMRFAVSQDHGYGAR
jgi:hypothetical protein